MAVSESAKRDKESKARKPKAKKGPAANEGEQPDGQGRSAEPQGERVRALDFSQPTKFTTEIRHRIAGALEPFCEELSGRLSSELKAEVQIGVSEIAQHTWAAAKAQLPADSLAVAVQESSIERQMLLSVELPLILQALECLLGGEAAQAPPQRHLSEIDWVLTRGLLDATVNELSLAWCDLGGPELDRGEVDLEGDAGVLSAVAEPTLAVKLHSSIDGASAAMSLLIPWAAVEPIAESIRAAGAPTQDGGAHGSEALRRGVAGAQVLLRAEVGSAQMGLERVLELVPGTLVALQERSGDGVLLYAEGVTLGRGRPGRSGTRRAIKLEVTGEPPRRADTFATLGRAELERARAHLAGGEPTLAKPAILSSIFVRVWAELGRTHLPLGRALELSPGAVVELDQDAQAPVELFANGLCFASGSLVVTGDGAWGVQIEQLT
jgi:flagellar motor switch protein FliM